MNRRDRDDQPVALAADAIDADDRALDAFGDRVWSGETPAVSWDTVDPALTVLALLRDDVAQEIPAPRTSWEGAAVVQLAPRRRRHLGRRSLVAGVVTATVLSVSGVAAAAIASGPGAALYPIHKLLLGPEPTSSQHAAAQVRHFLHLADGDLEAGRVTAAGEALQHATSWLAKVDATDRGDLPAQLAAMQSRYADALAVSETPGKGTANDDHGRGNAGDNNGADHRGGNGGSGSGKSGGSDDGTPGRSGDDHGNSGGGSGKSGDRGTSGGGSGHGSGGSSDGSSDGSSGGGSSGSGSSGSSGSDDSSGSGSGGSQSGSHGGGDVTGTTGSGGGHKGSDG
jgi:hypothetical protein